MNRRSKAIRSVSVVSAAGLLTVSAGWLAGVRPWLVLGATLLAVFIAYALMNVPQPYRRQGWGQVEQAVDNKFGKFGGKYAEGPNPPEHVTKVGRNEPCPCGSGLKFKQCCGAG